MSQKAFRLSFPAVLFVVQIVLLGFYAKYVNYRWIGAPDELDRKSLAHPAPQFYAHFQDVHVMIFVGIGFLLTFLKRYGYGALSYNLLLGSVIVQWSLLVNGWVRQRIQKEEHGSVAAPGQIYVGIQELMLSDFSAATILISFGGVMGKANRLQLLVMAVVECVFFAVNEAVIHEFLYISDVGAAISIHVFAAYFGVATAAILQNYGDGSPNESACYQSDITSMIGTGFLWVFWPSFNSGLLGNDPNQQNRAIVNTYLSLAACVAITFVISPLTHKKYKFDMAHVQNATLAGGVAVGSACNMLLQPWGAILCGMIAGAISTLGFSYVQPFLRDKLKIHDTCGIHNLHGLPGIFATIAGAVTAAAVSKEDYARNELASIFPKIAEGERSEVEQGGYQMAALFVTIGMSIVGGLLTGLLIKGLNSPKSNFLYIDEDEFEIPEQTCAEETSNGGTMEMKESHVA